MTTIPSGTRDFHPQQMKIRDEMFKIIRTHFEKHGAVSIGTPTFEHKSVLMGKYGDDEKLIFELKDQGGSDLALRYDHTVPLSRYIAANGIPNLVRYVIGDVYRRDNPSLAQGRFRQFTQCDIDFVGEYGYLKPDAECLKILSDILTDLQLGTFVIKVNHRALLDGIFELAGVSPDLFRTTCSSIDKLDKHPWEEIKKELLAKKLSETVVDQIGSLVCNNGDPQKILGFLQPMVSRNTNIAKGVADLTYIFTLLQNVWPEAYINVSFDLSMARGLDYYTGIIFEAVAISQNPTDPSSKIGSVAGGGRYDGLIGRMGTKDVPAVGFTVGVERIFAIKNRQNDPLRARGLTDVYIATIDIPDLEVMKLASQLWSNGFPAAYSYAVKTNVKRQLAEASDMGAKVAIILASNEMKAGLYLLKNMKTSEQKPIPVDQLLTELKKMM